MVQWVISLLIFASLLMIPVSVAEIPDDEVVMERYAHYTLGDYLEWDVEASGFMEAVGRASDPDGYLGYENATISVARKEMVGEETIKSVDKDHHCIVLSYTFDITFDVLYSDSNKTANKSLKRSL